MPQLNKDRMGSTDRVNRKATSDYEQMKKPGANQRHTSAVAPVRTSQTQSQKSGSSREGSVARENTGTAGLGTRAIPTSTSKLPPSHSKQSLTKQMGPRQTRGPSTSKTQQSD